MGRAFLGQLPELRQLALALSGDSPLVQVARVQLQVEPEAQTGELARERGRLDARWPVHEKARMRHDSHMMRLSNTAVASPARTEFVPLDDEPLNDPSSTT